MIPADWLRWSHPQSAAWAWLDDWLQAHPPAAAAVLELQADGAAPVLCWQRSLPPSAPLARPPTLPQLQALLQGGPAPLGREQLLQHAPLLAPWLKPQQALRAVPLVHAGRIGWCVLLQAAPASLAYVDLADFNLRAALALGGNHLQALDDAVQRKQAAITDLAEVQRLLQPDSPRIRGLQHALHWQPAETAAGDYYDLMPLSHRFEGFDATRGDAWGVMVGDVSGHGAAAAMETAQFDAILRTYRSDGTRGPGGALSYANRHFLSRRSRRRLMTVIAAGYRPDLGLLRYANAGHLPLLLRRGAQVQVHAEGDMPIGVLPDTEYQDHDLPVQHGDLLLLCTDGVPEARDRAGREFGMDRLRRLFAVGPEQPQELLQHLLTALFEHQAGAIGRDDQTLVVLRIG